MYTHPDIHAIHFVYVSVLSELAIRAELGIGNNRERDNQSVFNLSIMLLIN